MAYGFTKIGIMVQLATNTHQRTSTMQDVTVAPHFVKCMLEGARIKGYNVEEILKAQGIPVQILSNPKLRISTKSFAALGSSIIQLLQDETFGLLEKPQPIGTLHFLLFACLSARTIEESLRLWKKGVNLIENSLSITFQATEETGTLAIRCKKKNGILSNYIVETSLLSIHRAHCWLAKEFIPIKEVELMIPEPSFVDEYPYLFYGAPVRFNQTRNAISFSRHSLDLPCNQNPESLDTLMQAPLVRLLTQPRQSTSLAIRVRLWLEGAFRESHHSPKLDYVAAHMKLTPQTLKRHLKKDGYVFQKLKEDTRRDMAIHLILQKQHSIEGIAFKLGYSEASTFIRAFKHWTGLTPLAYRKNFKHSSLNSDSSNADASDIIEN
jgi:AraC-like DNA-binding protein